MATTAEKDDHDDKDEAAEESAAEAEEKKAAAAAADEDDEDEVPAKPAKPVSKAATKRAAGRPARVRPTAPAQKGSSLGKSMILFVFIIGGLALGFALLGREGQQGEGPAKPKWKVGDTADVEITLVKTDKQELSCASAEEIGGKHCAFEAMNKPWSKGDSADDKKLMKPYTTTDRVQFAAAGLWSEPVLAADKIPAVRFSVKCKLKVEGMLKNVAVRWESTGQWFPGNEWYAGSVSDCKITP